MACPTKFKFESIADEAVDHLRQAALLVNSLLNCTELAPEQLEDIATTSESIDNELHHVEYNLMPNLANALAPVWEEQDLEDL